MSYKLRVNTHSGSKKRRIQKGIRTSVGGPAGHIGSHGFVQECSNCVKRVGCKIVANHCRNYSDGHETSFRKYSRETARSKAGKKS